MLNFLKRKRKEIAIIDEIKPIMQIQPSFPFNTFNSWFAQFDGSSYPGLYGQTRDFNGICGLDYYTLRIRSRQQFEANAYAKQIVNRLSTNIVNSGFKLKAKPNKYLLNLSQEQYTEWTKKVDSLFEMWANDISCDYEQKTKMGGLEQQAFLDALIEGDILVILRTDDKTFLPKIQLIPGRFVRNPLFTIMEIRNKNIVDGVEFDSEGKQIAYWVDVPDPQIIGFYKSIRIPRYGEKTNRLNAFLVYGQQPDTGKIRGNPLLTPVLEKLAQLGDYTGSELQAAKINSLLAMWIEKTQDRPGSNPFEGLSRKTSEAVSPSGSVPVPTPRTFMPQGLVIDELNFGEKINSFRTDRPNVNFRNFNDDIISLMASALEIPPEIVQLKFQSNYSASRQATIEFKTYVTKARGNFTSQFNQNIFDAWLFSMVVRGLINAPGYIDAVLNEDVFIKNAWQGAQYIGIVKQNVDIFKEGNAYKNYVDEGWLTRSRAAEDLTGYDYDDTIDKLREENQRLAEARAPLLDQQNISGINESIS